MAGEKQTIEIELNNDHVTFMRIMKDDYNIPTESKVMRIIMDYLQENKDVHDTVFKQTRCLRCEQIARHNRHFSIHNIEFLKTREFRSDRGIVEVTLFRYPCPLLNLTSEIIGHSIRNGRSGLSEVAPDEPKTWRLRQAKSVGYRKRPAWSYTDVYSRS